MSIFPSMVVGKLLPIKCTMLGMLQLDIIYGKGGVEGIADSLCM